MLAMQRAVQGLRLKPNKVLVDGNRLPSLDMLAEAIVSGDALVPAISAASILAKVTRDRLLDELHLQHPAYGFDRHKGYGTVVHLQALQTLGALPEHRRSFAPVARVLAVPLAKP
jgi:ribonuclease HII